MMHLRALACLIRGHRLCYLYPPTGSRTPPYYAREVWCPRCVWRIA